MKTDEQLNDLARKSSAGIFTSTNAAADYETGFYYGYRAAEQAKQWVLIAERLPDCIRIIAATGGLVITLTYIDEVYYTCDGNIWVSPVIAWMPAPRYPSPLQINTRS